MNLQWQWELSVIEFLRAVAKQLLITLGCSPLLLVHVKCSRGSHSCYKKIESNAELRNACLFKFIVMQVPLHSELSTLVKRTSNSKILI